MEEKQAPLPIVRMDQSGVVEESLFAEKLIRPSLAEIRRIAIGKKGEKVVETQGGARFRPPVKLDHFIVTLCSKDEKDDFIVDEEFHAKYGPKPRMIPIQFVFDRPGLNAHIYLAVYGGRRPLCKGNGQVALRAQKDGSRRQVDCPCEHLESGKCKAHLRLQCLLPSQPIGTVSIFRSTSKYTISYITGGMRHIMQMTAAELNRPWQMGILAEIPLQLTLMKKTVPAKDKVHTIPVVTVSFAGDLDQLREKAKRRMDQYLRTIQFQKQLEAQQASRLLEAGDPKEEKDIAEEFHPENIDAKTIEDIPERDERSKERQRKDVEEFQKVKKDAQAAITEAQMPSGIARALDETKGDLDVLEDSHGPDPEEGGALL